MSAGYATKLSYREDLGGQLGDPELTEAPSDLQAKLNTLCDWVRHSNKIVVFTGAGISTSCGIPDFRGPSGIWTLQRAHKPIPAFTTSFGIAKPSLTHQALVALLDMGKLKYIASQNVDGLHLRSGIPRSNLAELHGNCFAERCCKCKQEYIRDFEMETVGFKYTGRRCSIEGCNGRLKDHILDWEDALPEDELQASEKAAAEADLAICLGTSLQITPACNIPLKTVKAGGKLVIINLQKTPKDKKANLVIHAKCDDVMQLLMSQLQYPIPSYTRQDAVLVHHSLKKGKQLLNGVQRHSCTISVESIHGPKCPLPLIQQVEMQIEDTKSRPASLRKQPYMVVRSLQTAQTCVVTITLQLSQVIEEAYRSHSFQYTIRIGDDAPETAHQKFKFVTQLATYNSMPALTFSEVDSHQGPGSDTGAPAKKQRF